jgi:GT2 family glycosyltransferase
MRISVVIATFNRAPSLRTSLEQLRMQRYESGDEVVVVDNGSVDETPKVIASVAADFPVPLRHLREPTPGKTPALIAGLATARGDVLALTDDDVMVGTDWIATVRRIFSDPSIALVGGRVDPIWERPAPHWLQLGDEDSYTAMAGPLALLHYGGEQALGPRTAVGANLVVRRDVMEALGGFVAHLGRQPGTLLSGEDHDFCQRAVAAGYRCEYRPELRVGHRVPANRLRLRYFLRWFFWSGVTEATLDGWDGTVRSRSRLVTVRYFARRLLTAALFASIMLLRGRRSEAAVHAMAAASAAGYLTQRMGNRRRGVREQFERLKRLAGVQG